ncbi:MAG: rod shape-determining protein MreC, partial [Hyphomonadaceae bacterium]|nr:rod shape-determining protein MreC [Clostridia bacterium]
MSDFFGKKHYVVFLVIALVLVALMIASATNRQQANFIENTLGFIVTPMQQATTGVKSGVRNTFLYFSDNQKIRQQNEAYEIELSALRNENFALKQMDVENKRLRQMLDFKRTNAQFELVGANVIAKDASNWFQKFTIDKGTNDGLTKDCAVINHQGLVGSIYDIGLNYAKVSAIIDDSSAVSALVVRTK